MVSAQVAAVMITAQTTMYGILHLLVIVPTLLKTIVKWVLTPVCMVVLKQLRKWFNRPLKLLRNDLKLSLNACFLVVTRSICEVSKEHGIMAQYNMLGSMDQNGVAKRRNHTLMDMVRSMLSNSKLPWSMWIEALKITAYILNRV